MAEKQYFATILKCAICKKEGIVHIFRGATVESKLQTQSGRSGTGFKYGPICGSEWTVACQECFDKGKAIIDKQKLERENFLKGE